MWEARPWADLFAEQTTSSPPLLPPRATMASTAETYYMAGRDAATKEREDRLNNARKKVGGRSLSCSPWAVPL